MSLTIKKRLGTGNDAPVLIALHGLGSNEEDLFAFAREIDPRVEFITVRAPHPYSGGFSWFPIEFLPDGSRIIDEEIALRSRDLLLTLVSEFAGRQVLMAGFSQGAMIASGVALKSPNELVGAWLMSGRWLPPFGDGDLRGLPVLVQHGIYDPVLIVQEGQELAKELSARGGIVQYKEYPMAHEVSYQSLSDALTWMHERLDLP